MNRAIESDYDLEMDRVIREIKKSKSKRVVIQLPDGMKPLATDIAKEIESKTKAKVLIWLGTCFGACDTPPIEKLKPKVDLLIQWGHSEWKN